MTKVVASLQYGRIWSRKSIYVVWIIFIVAITSLSIYAFLCFFAEHNYIYLIMLLLPGIILLAIPYLIFQTWLFYKTNKWAENAVELMAQCVSYKRSFLRVGYRGLSSIETAKVVVKFTYNGKSIKKMSGIDNKTHFSGFYNKGGFDNVFVQFADKKVKILYNEQADQVLFVK